MGWRRTLIGLVGSATFLVLLLRQVGGGELRDAIGEADPRWLVLALLVYFVALWMRGLRWWLVLRDTVPVGPSDATALVVIGYAANNVLPVRVGELVRADLLYRSHGTSRLTGLGTIVVERVLDGLVLVSFLAGTIALAGGNGPLRVLAVLMALLFIGLSIALFVFGPSLARDSERLLWLLGLVPGRFRLRARHWSERFVVGLLAVRGARAWSAIVAVTAVSWAIEAMMYWLVGTSLGLDLHPLLYLGVCGAANLAIAVPSTSGGIGPFEYFAREALVAFGSGVALGTAYAITLHVLLLIPVAVLGLVLLWQRQIAVRSVLRAPAALVEVPADEPRTVGRVRGAG